MIEEKILYDKIYACWLGKNIGGTLGAPVEGRKDVMDIKWYPKLPEGAALPNDDLDLQLLNLHAAEQHGTALSSSEIAAEWCEHVYFPWDEYGAALTALRRGFVPPFSGGFDNHFTDCMGAPIRSEIWACACAGNPRGAAYFAWQDAVVDHAGGEGVWGEIFNAVLEASAFVENDREKLIESALSFIPADCRVHRAVKYALELYRAKTGYTAARDLLLAEHGHHNFTDAPQNIAFQVIGLLWGGDFEDVIIKTVNLGYDTDCTVATVGALLGIMYGRDYIPEKWSAPVGDAICLSPQIRGFKAPENLEELTLRTMALRTRLSALPSENTVVKLPDADDSLDLLSQRHTIPAGCSPCNGVELRVYYDGEPYIDKGTYTGVTVRVFNNTTWQWTMRLSVVCPAGFDARFKITEADEVSLTVPAGESGEFSFSVGAHEDVGDSNRFDILVKRMNNGDVWNEYRVPFVLIAPQRWRVGGVIRRLTGSTLDFSRLKDYYPEDGIYVAEGVLRTPVSRRTQIICASEVPLDVELDGAKVISSPGLQPFMPAYHRAPASQKTELELPAGDHSIRVELKSQAPPRFVFATTAPRKVAEPGNYYAYTDNRMI